MSSTEPVKIHQSWTQVGLPRVFSGNYLFGDRYPTSQKYHCFRATSFDGEKSTYPLRGCGPGLHSGFRLLDYDHEELDRYIAVCGSSELSNSTLQVAVLCPDHMPRSSQPSLIGSWQSPSNLPHQGSFQTNINCIFI
jgi:hypothetical protein